jgi:arylsulfatase A-like enzyme
MRNLAEGAGVLLALIAGVSVAGVLRAADSPPRPNVLILLSDDQRADTIATLGNSHICTPTLDRLVQEGTAFTRAYCMGALQGAVCVPSRAMLMTGRTLFRVDPQLRGQTTWPEMFARAGYQTFMTGKWHNGPGSACRVFQEGRAVFFGGMGDPYRLPVEDFSDGGPPRNARVSGRHSVALFADEAIAFLQRPHHDRPFLCYVAFNAPHDPRVAPKSYHEAYNAAPPPLPTNFLPRHPFDNGELDNRDERLAPCPRTPAIVRRHLADYYAAITFLDAQVGRILDALRATGAAERTLIVYTSDHGLAIGSHGLFGKQNLYDHSMHAPLFLAGPGIPKDRRSDALCYLLDIFPTVGDLAKVPAPPGSEGVSLVPVLAGKQPSLRTTIFTAYRDVQRAVRDDRWKLILYPRTGRVQLFDLQDDPAECKDLSAVPAHAAVRDRLLRLLLDSQRQVGDTSLKVGAAPSRWNKRPREVVVQPARGRSDRTTGWLLAGSTRCARSRAKQTERQPWLTTGNRPMANTPGSGCGCGRIRTPSWLQFCSWPMPFPFSFVSTRSGKPFMWLRGSAC